MPAILPTRRHRVRAPQIERETGLVPLAAAREVLDEASACLGVRLPGRFAVRIAFMVHRVYAHSPSFRRHLRRPDDRARDKLYAYLRHWLAARLHEERSDLYRHLPAEFARSAPPASMPDDSPLSGSAAWPTPASSHGFDHAF
jgi:hypothetical protein